MASHRSSDKQIHYYETFSNAPPSFKMTLTSVQLASEYVAKSSEDEDSDASHETEDFPLISTANIHKIFDVFTIVWCDPLGYESQEYQQVQNEVRKQCSQLLTFTNIIDCQHYFDRSLTTDKIILIVRSSFGLEFIPVVHSCQNLIAVYIYCDSDEDLKEWSSNHPKIKNIVKKIDQLILVIEKDLNEQKTHEDRTLSTSFYDGSSMTSTGYSHKNLSKENGAFVWFQLYSEALLHMNRRELSKYRRKIIKICREHYKNNRKMVEQIDEFQKTYNRDEAIRWYTHSTFLYQPLNKALRQNDVETLLIYGFFLRDLNRRLRKLKQSFTVPFLRLYRGQALHKDELQQMQQNQGHIISINSLFSTSHDRSVARTYAESSVTGDRASQGYAAALFEVEAMTTYDDEESRPFGDITSLSHYKEEAEVLFMAGCVFRLISVKYSLDENIWIIKISLCSQNDHELSEFFRWLRRCINGQTNLGTLCFILRDMGRLDQAERLFEHLSSNTERTGAPTRLIPLGQIAAAKKEYDRAMNYYQQVLRHLTENEGDPVIVGVLYTYIGHVHFDQKDFNSARLAYEEAFTYLISSVDEQHLDTANVYEGLGKTTLALGESQSALEYLQKCVEIRRRFLPKFHPSLAPVEYLLGETSRALGDFDAALRHFQESLDIQKRNYSSDDDRIRQTTEAIRNLQDLNKSQSFI